MATYLLLVTLLQDRETFILPIYTTDPHNEVTAFKTQIKYQFEYLFIFIYLLAFIYISEPCSQLTTLCELLDVQP